MSNHSRDDQRIVERGLEHCSKAMSELALLKHKMCEETQYEDGHISVEIPLQIMTKAAKIMDCMSGIASGLSDYNPSLNEDYIIRSFNEEGFGISLTKEGWIRMVLPPATSINTNKIYAHGAHNRTRFIHLVGRFKQDLPDEIRGKYPLEKATIVFKHVVHKDRYRMTDYDNSESRSITNALAGAMVLADDSPDHINTYHCSERSEFSALVVYVIPQNEFWDWLKNNQKESFQPIQNIS